MGQFWAALGASQNRILSPEIGPEIGVEDGSLSRPGEAHFPREGPPPGRFSSLCCGRGFRPRFSPQRAYRLSGGMPSIFAPLGRSWTAVLGSGSVTDSEMSISQKSLSFEWWVSSSPELLQPNVFLKHLELVLGPRLGRQIRAKAG